MSTGISIRLTVIALCLALMSPGLHAEANNPKECTITSTTAKHAADGTTPDSRATVGVCEKVTFAVDPAMVAVWTADDGDPKTGNGKTFAWTAPEKENAKVTITATMGTTVCKKEMKVIKPASAAWKKLDSTITAGYGANAGCQMKLKELTLTPLTVNFERIQVQEVSGPASDIEGYFKNDPPFSNTTPKAGPPPVAAGLLYHRADGTTGLGNGVWQSINSKNLGNGTDTAGAAPPGIPPGFVQGGFTDGTFTWAIPMNYRCVDNAAGAGINFATINQVTTIKKDGTLSVTKDDAAICKVSRTP